jgi:hypothetical protein
MTYIPRLVEEEHMVKEESFEEYTERVKSYLRDRQPPNVHFNIVVIPYRDAEEYQTNKDCEDLILRLQEPANTKDKERVLLNPEDANTGQNFRALNIDEFLKLCKELEHEGLKFSPADTLYITSHANQVTFNGFRPEQLAEILDDPIKKTGLNNIKLAGCHTGSRVFPESLTQEARQYMQQKNVLEEAVTNSYAKKLSQSILSKGAKGVRIYGYMSDMNEKYFPGMGKHSKEELHSAVTFSEMKGANKKPKKQKVETKDVVRASEARACYVDGDLVEGPKVGKLSSESIRQLPVREYQDQQTNETNYELKYFKTGL